MVTKKKVLISTDTSSDLTRSEMDGASVRYVAVPYIKNGETVTSVVNSHEDAYLFYDELENGLMPTTSQINEAEHTEYFETLLKETSGDIIHFSLSSGLSSTYAAALRAAENLNSGLKRPRLRVFDTLGATQAGGELVRYAVKLRDEGKSADEIFSLTGQRRDGQQIWIIVNNLQHLKRGGRVSGAAAAIGAVLNIKPIINLDNLGHLTIQFKERGFNKALARVCKLMHETGINLKEQTVLFVNTGRATDALIREAADKITKKFGCAAEFRFIGPVIGSHTGADTVAVVFQGKPRFPRKK